MAEVFGIVSGTAGIVSVFSTCMECFDYVQTGRRFGKDFQVDLLTLSLLKLRLSRWGEAVQIYDDPKLGHPEATDTDVQLAENTLRQILVLFEDSNNISNKYRLEARQGEDLTPLTRGEMEPRFAAIDNKMKALAERRQKSTGFRKLASWALYHRDRYNDLVEGITKLVDNLEQAFPAPEKANALAKTDTEQISAGPPAEQKDTLKLLGFLAAKVDGAVGAKAVKAVEAAANQGISIGSVDTTDKARFRSGDFVSTAWKGETSLPQSGITVAIGSLRAGGESRVMAGNMYAEKDSFWD
ncbi:prion-inhibition and propagation-domain-containing protein [Dichotomopilus funicola]|uniref:Prion-inhibition and propagation-domain-containing protein n=1 Tax=Dichotomopilus funicola TaxID=1934379 RepID=A0AAN6V0L7_9PEZI|nr:prion-inhibition and propagation-domain-containing protein [Dichotomopilus funicola]